MKAAIALTEEQRDQVRAAVIRLVQRHGTDHWELGELAVEVGSSVPGIDVIYPSASFAVVDAHFAGSTKEILRLTETAPVGGRTPRSRVIRSTKALSALFLTPPDQGRALLRAMVSGGAPTGPLVRDFEEQVQMMLARALAGGEPGDPEWLAAEVIEKVWLAAMFLWAAETQDEEAVDSAVARTLRMLKVNG